MDMLLSAVLEDAIDDLMDEVIDSGEVEIIEDEEDGIFAHPQMEDIYEDPYIQDQYSDEEDEVEDNANEYVEYPVDATESDNDLDAIIDQLDDDLNDDKSDDEDDIFVDESALINNNADFFTNEDADILLDELDHYLNESKFFNTIVNSDKYFTESVKSKAEAFITMIKKFFKALWERIIKVFREIKTKIKNFLTGETAFYKKVKEFPEWLKRNKSTNESAVFTEADRNNTTHKNDKIKPKNIDQMTPEELLSIYNQKEAEKNRKQQQNQQYIEKIKAQGAAEAKEKALADELYRKEREEYKKAHPLTKTQAAFEDTELLWYDIDPNNRENATLKENLYDQMITTFDIDQFNKKDLDTVINDTNLMDMTLKILKLDSLFGGASANESRTELISKYVKGVYFNNKQPVKRDYIYMLRNIKGVSDQFLSLVKFLNETLTNLDYRVSDLERKYEKILKRYEVDYLNLQKDLDKQFTEDREPEYASSHIIAGVTKYSKDKEGNMTIEHEKFSTTKENIKRVQDKLLTLKSVCSNHVNLMKAHYAALWNCTSIEYRINRHTLLVLMSTTGFYNKKDKRAFSALPSVLI